MSDSDEDNFVEHVEFNEGQHCRKAIFGYGVDSGDLKVLNCDRYDLHFSRTNLLIHNREGVLECQGTIFQFLFLYRSWSIFPCFVESGIILNSMQVFFEAMLTPHTCQNYAIMRILDLNVLIM